MISGLNARKNLLISPRAKSSATTTTANIDTMGAAYLELDFMFSSAINTNAVGPTIAVSQSDDTVVSNFATIVANRTAEVVTNAKVLSYGIDLRGKKRYIRVSVTTPAATNDDSTYAVLARLSRLQEGPGSTTELVATTNDAAVIVG